MDVKWTNYNEYVKASYDSIIDNSVFNMLAKYYTGKFSTSDENDIYNNIPLLWDQSHLYFKKTVIFSALSIESYINYLGDKLYKDRKYFQDKVERQNINSKIGTIFNDPPLQSRSAIN
jgi:hypothetical protein